ncbi:hypothetical protein UlMin_038914 [Ulmus minor]
MSRLSSEQVLKDNTTRDSNSIETLTLNHKALSDVSCLGEFKNLSRLDLRLNNLTSLEGLKLCSNLKWLSVAENKLVSLKGVEALSKLTVLNAGKNKLKSMNEVRSITSLRALILNDNEINSICKLDQMKELNTLVLSKNPISGIGDSLAMVKSLTKLSLSHCQLQNIGASLKSCVELKELRLAHNDIKSLPAELAHNKHLQNLDLGNNVISRWSDLKVLDSLTNLKNLNLLGNPIVTKDKLVKKIKKVLPNLHVFNSKPIDKYLKKEKVNKSDNDEEEKETRDHVRRKNSIIGEDKDVNLDSASDIGMKKSLKRTRQDSGDSFLEKPLLGKIHSDADSEKQLKQKIKEKNSKHQKKKVTFQDEDDSEVKKKTKKKRGELDVIDDREAPFTELLAVDRKEDSEHGVEKKIISNASRDLKSMDGVVIFPAKKKKDKPKGTGFVLELAPEVEIGMGGSSTWGDE